MGYNQQTRFNVRQNKVIVEDNVIVSKLPFSNKVSATYLEYYSFAPEQQKFAMSDTAIMTTTIYQGNMVFTESFKVLTVYDVLGVVGGIQVIVLNVLVLVMMLFQRTDLNATIISRLYAEREAQPYRPKSWAVLRAWAAEAITFCCPCRRNWQWY